MNTIKTSAIVTGGYQVETMHTMTDGTVFAAACTARGAAIKYFYSEEILDVVVKFDDKEVFHAQFQDSDDPDHFACHNGKWMSDNDFIALAQSL